MPDLKCTVQTCVHNYKFLCDLDKIQVGGDTAKTAQETCCDSFQERKEGSYMNAAVSEKSIPPNIPQAQTAPHRPSQHKEY